MMSRITAVLAELSEVDVRVAEARANQREAADLVGRVACLLDDFGGQRVVRHGQQQRRALLMHLPPGLERSLFRVYEAASACHTCTSFVVSLRHSHCRLHRVATTATSAPAGGQSGQGAVTYRAIDDRYGRL
jgi:hypothetical protein